MKLGLLLLLSCALALGAEFRLDSIPDGYPPGRANTAFGSTFKNPARPYDRLLDMIQNKVYGLAKLVDETEIRQSELTYYLEHLTIGVHLRIANAPVASFTVFEREALLYRATRLYEDIRGHAERLYEIMIRIVDRELPGSTGVQLATEIDGELEQLYTSNCRSEFCLSPEERLAFYAKKKAEFLAGGASLGEIKRLNGDLVTQLGLVTFLEYVVRPNQEIWVTPGKAGHLILAEGGDVLSAGQIVIVKEISGAVSMAIATNASGNYKPDLFSAERLGDRLSTELKVPRLRCLVTKGEPLSTQTVRILMKAAKKPAEEIKAVSGEMEKLAKQMQAHPEQFLTPLTGPTASCPQLLTY